MKLKPQRLILRGFFNKKQRIKIKENAHEMTSYIEKSNLNYNYYFNLKILVLFLI